MKKLLDAMQPDSRDCFQSLLSGQGNIEKYCTATGNKCGNWKVLQKKIKSLENYSCFVFLPSDVCFSMPFFQLFSFLAHGGTACAFSFQLIWKMYVSILTPWVEVARLLKHGQKNWTDSGAGAGASSGTGAYHRPSSMCDKYIQS